MARVKSENTTPEMAVRSWLHHNGYRFRLYRKDLPGCPDIALPKYKTVVFVHGCFWHRHEGCKRASTPESNKEYWLVKFERNVARDERVRQELQDLGWRVVVIWECEVRNVLSSALLRAAIGPEKKTAF